MTITKKSIKLLWANAAGRCSFTDCNKRLTVEQAAASAPYTLGQMAHIKGEKEKSNRHDKTQTPQQRDDYKNLILLCPNHHTLIDKPENEKIYSPRILTEMKLEHEARISQIFDTQNISNLDKLKNEISIYLAENHQVWLQYGPLSESARKNPHSEEIYAVWFFERLSTIVPNNRIIVSLLNTHRKLFNKQAQSIISSFITHANSYEKWVNDEIPYQAVLPFPKDFENLILRT